MLQPHAIIESERETSQGWEFDVRLERDGRSSRHVVRLAWPDHDHWSGGAVPPSHVVEALVRVADANLDALPARFDASTLRRLIDECDAKVRAEIDQATG